MIPTVTKRVGGDKSTMSLVDLARGLEAIAKMSDGVQWKYEAEVSDNVKAPNGEIVVALKTGGNAGHAVRCHDERLGIVYMIHSAAMRAHRAEVTCPLTSEEDAIAARAAADVLGVSPGGSALEVIRRGLKRRERFLREAAK